MRRILVADAQIFQTPAWDRGMGKFSLELLAALEQLNKQKGYWDSIKIILSKQTPESGDYIPPEKQVLAEVRAKVPLAKVVRLNLAPNEVGNPNIPKDNREIVDAYIKSLGNIDEVEVDFLILSLLQHETYPVFPSLPNVHKALVHHDLIPLIFHRMYLNNPYTRVEYFSKFEELLRADCYLGNSKLTSNDLALYLGISKGRIATIDGGPINHSKNGKKVNIPKPYILMPTGNDPRKNNLRGIRGFTTFNQRHKNRYSLVITSFFKPFEIEALQKMSPHLIFTGNVSGEEMAYLFAESEAVLFPPEYEGLGLPVLEAIENNRPVACSDIAVFHEMSDTAFVYFNHKQVGDIADALDRVTDPGYTVDQKAYKEVLNEYTWRRSAEKAAHAMLSSESTPIDNKKPSIAIFGPDPAYGFGIGKHLHEGHGELSRHFNIDYYTEIKAPTGSPRINFLPYITKSTDITTKTSINFASYKTVIYHVSNDSNCVSTLFTALAIPGIAIVHDLVLDRSWHELLSSGLIDKSRLELETALDRKYGETGTKYLVSLIARQKALIVFDEKKKQKLEKLLTHLGKDIPIVVGKLPTTEVVYERILPKKANAVTAVIHSQAELKAYMDIDVDDYQKVIVSNRSQDEFEIVPSEQITIVENATDIDYFDKLSRAQLFFAPKNGEERSFNTIDAVKYNTLPIDSARGIEDFPRDCVAKHPLEATESTGNPVTRKKINRYLDDGHTYRDYAELLARLVEDYGA